MKKTRFFIKITLLFLALAGNTLMAEDAAPAPAPVDTSKEATPAATPAPAENAAPADAKKDAVPADAGKNDSAATSTPSDGNKDATTAEKDKDKNPTGTETAPNIDPAQQQVEIKEAIRRKALLFKKSKELEDIQILVNTGKYDDADKALQGFLTDVPNVGDTAILHTKVADMSATIAVHRGKVALDAHQYYEAKRQAAVALKLQPENKEALAILIAADKVLTAGMSPVVGPDGKTVTPPNPALTESFLKRLERVQTLLKEAQDYFETGQYDEAAKIYRLILSTASNPEDTNDPYNMAAMRGLDKVIGIQRAFAEKSTVLNNTRREVAVRSEWSRKFTVEENTALGETSTSSQPIPISRSNDFDINQRLKNLRIRAIDFKDAPLTEIAQVLTTRSREADVQDKRGVLVLVAQDAAAKARPVTISLRDIPVSDALRYIARLANVKYRVDPEGVTFVPLEAPTDVFVVRDFDVPASFVQPSDAGAPEAAPVYDPRRRPTGVEETQSTDTVKKALIQKGVTFVGEASAVYNAALGKLTVKNTQDQIDFIEQLVISFEANLNIAKVIKFDTRILEVQVQNLNDLSFDWGTVGGIGTSSLTSGNWAGNYETGTSGSALSIDAMQGHTGTINSGNANGTGLGTARSLRNASSLPIDGLDAVTSGVRAADVTSNTATTNFNTLNIRAFINNMQLQTMLTALSQRTDTNLMSAPSILINSGSGEGLIEVVQDFIYPKEYAAPKVTIPGAGGGGGGGGAAAGGVGIPMALPAWPTAFVDPARKVGISIRVIAATANDTNTKVAIEMEPTITDFVGFIDYGSPIYADDYTYTTEGANPVTYLVPFDPPLLLSANPVRVPIFSVRAFDGGFKADVLDGYTVVMAGLLREAIDTIDDKVPILGDIPLIGRAFRSKVDRAVRKNLLIMVTPRILQPNGQPVNPDAGMPKVQPVAMN